MSNRSFFSFFSLSCLKQMFLFGAYCSFTTYFFSLNLSVGLVIERIHIPPYYNWQVILNHTIWEMSHFLPEEMFGTILLPVQIILISFHVTLQFGSFSQIHYFFFASFFGFLDYKCKLKKCFQLFSEETRGQHDLAAKDVFFLTSFSYLIKIFLYIDFWIKHIFWILSSFFFWYIMVLMGSLMLSSCSFLWGLLLLPLEQVLWLSFCAWNSEISQLSLWVCTSFHFSL